MIETMKLAPTMAVVTVILIAVSVLVIYNEASNQLCMGCASHVQSNSSMDTTSTAVSDTSLVSGISSFSHTATTWSASGYVTGTSVAGANDTFFAPNFPCSPSIGGFQLRIVSDSSATPVTGETINATGTLGVDCNGQLEIQVVHIDRFSIGQMGWLMPIFPSQALEGGNLNFTVAYQGKTYNFAAGFPPVGTNCATLSVPSGTVTRTTVMNGIGSYCFQG